MCRWSFEERLARGVSSHAPPLAVAWTTFFGRRVLLALPTRDAVMQEVVSTERVKTYAAFCVSRHQISLHLDDFLSI